MDCTSNSNWVCTNNAETDDGKEQLQERDKQMKKRSAHKQCPQREDDYWDACGADSERVDLKVDGNLIGECGLMFGILSYGNCVDWWKC